MKSNNRYQRMKRIAARALVLGMIANAVLFAASCKEDECDNECKLASNFFLWMTFTDGRGLFYFEPCPYDHNLSPGDSFVFDIPDPPYAGLTSMAGCSPAPWTLTATPSVGITANISRSIRAENMQQYKCNADITLAKSATPGAPVSISGPDGCISSGTDVISIWGYGATGTVAVNFD